MPSCNTIPYHTIQTFHSTYMDTDKASVISILDDAQTGLSRKLVTLRLSSHSQAQYEREEGNNTVVNGQPQLSRERSKKRYGTVHLV
jgi:hypothetical protein